MTQSHPEWGKGTGSGLKFGVMGAGSVGSSMIHALSRFYPYEVYDICESYPFERLLGCDAVFICVPTNADADGRLDCSVVSECIGRLVSSGYGGVVVVKSTLRVGYCDALRSRVPDLRLVYMPEFLRERNCYSWCSDPDRLVVAGRDDDVDVALAFFDWMDGSVVPQRMSYAEAEFGKVVHNAYIATKVSFTNSIEMASKAGGMDPEKVMGVVWADRRVVSREHLRPGLGGFAGKCIPKDTSEAIGYMGEVGADTSLMESVVHVHSMVVPSESPPLPDVYVIVPVSQQDLLYERALESLSRQSVRPAKVLVSYDESTGLSDSLAETVGRLSDVLGIELVCNRRAQSLSGAVNSALTMVPDEGDPFVSVLDDDDFWDTRYLQNCLKFAEDVGCDMVVSGLIRHDAEHPEGFRQSIPDSLSIHDFLVGNPGVQGSNLFVRASRLRSAGGFSEDLVSTTDRDVCIRLLQGGTRVGILHNHMVHHDAVSRRGRLSDFNGDRKRQGLSEFYIRYRGMMDGSEREAFHRRSRELFGIDTSQLDGEAERWISLW